MIHNTTFNKYDFANKYDFFEIPFFPYKTLIDDFLNAIFERFRKFPSQEKYFVSAKI